MDTFSIRDIMSRTYSSVAFYRTAIFPRDRFRVGNSEPTKGFFFVESHELKVSTPPMNLLGIWGKNSRIRPSYNGRNYVVVGRAVVIPFNII